MSSQQAFVRPVLNLDSIFNNPYINLTGEPITPTKIALFYLIRKLFHAHFGIGAVPSLKPLNKDEKTKAFSIIYGLILMESEISYHNFRRIVRVLNEEIGRSIYYHFVLSMEKLGHGDEQIEMLFENAFYNGKRPSHPMALKRKNEELDNLSFMSNNSFLYTWIKRVMIQYTRTSQSGLFLIGERMREWILAGNLEKVSSISFGINVTLPFEIDCSIRARQWITKQFSLVQLCPTTAMSYNEIIDWSDIICQRHRDILEVHLLKTIVYIQLRNQPDAVKSLKTFFDLSMLQMTESAQQAMDLLTFMSPSQNALRYGPILQGRIHRLFGNRKQADDLFTESIQQSQLNTDDMCNRIANMELTINAILMSGPILERAYNEETKNDQDHNNNDGRGDRRVLQNTIHAAANINIPHIRSLQKSFTEDYDLHTYLVLMSKYMIFVEDMMDGKFFRCNGTSDYVSFALHRFRLTHDTQNKGRVLEDFADSIMTSALIQSGMYKQAHRTAKFMLVNNCSSPCCPKLETESQAVAGVNLVYSLAAVGDYETAFSTISSLESVFPENINWMSARHITICNHILQFERDFLLNRYPACADHLRGLSSYSPLEYTLRKSLLLATIGKLSDAVTLLKTYKCEDVRGSMRIQMQLGTIHTGHGHFEKAEYHLNRAANIAMNTHFQDANPLVARRFGCELLARSLPQEAYQVLLAVKTKIEHYGSYVEKAILHVSIARCLRLLNKDPREYLKNCKLEIINGTWPAMEKLLLTELTLLHDHDGMFPDENKSAWAKEKFGKIEEDYPGPCSWMLI